MNDTKLTFQEKSASADEIFFHLQLCNESFVPPLDQKVNLAEYARKIFEKSITFEAWHDHKLVGLIAAYFNDVAKQDGYITSVSVIPAYKGKGIASALMKRCIEFARQQHFRHITLEVHEKNDQAIQLYKKFNFTIFEHRNALFKMKWETDSIQKT
jgi:ribosomal protein S18 acetylase RimI-like enzyme